MSALDVHDGAAAPCLGLLTCVPIEAGWGNVMVRLGDAFRVGLEDGPWHAAIGEQTLRRIAAGS